MNFKDISNALFSINMYCLAFQSCNDVNDRLGCCVKNAVYEHAVVVVALHVECS